MAGTQRVKYQTDNGNIFNVVLDESSGISTLIGTVPTSPYTENMTIKVSKNTFKCSSEHCQVYLCIKKDSTCWKDWHSKVEFWK